MKMLEERLRYVFVGPARNAFRQVGEYFSTDLDLIASLAEELKRKYPENPIPVNTVASSLQNSKRKKMDARISDLMLAWGDQVSVGEPINASNFLFIRRKDQPRVFDRIRSVADSLMDYYQFRSTETMAAYLHEDKSFDYRLVMGVLEGRIHANLTTEIRRMYLVMSDMLHQAINNAPIKIPHKHVIRTMDSDKAESLDAFTERALIELLGHRYEQESKGYRDYIAQAMEGFKKIGQLIGLVKTVTELHGFPDNESTYSRFYKLLELEPLPDIQKSYKKDSLRTRSKPSHIHRKLYVVALILGRHVPREKYKAEIDSIKRIGITKDDIAEAVSSLLGIPASSATAYINGNRDSMAYSHYGKLRHFVEKELPSVYTVDISGEKRKMKFNKFKRSYRGGRVLVKMGQELTPDDIGMLQVIRDMAHFKGLPFLYPAPGKIIEGIEGYIHWKELFKIPSYARF